MSGIIQDDSQTYANFTNSIDVTNNIEAVKVYTTGDYIAINYTSSSSSLIGTNLTFPDSLYPVITNNSDIVNDLSNSVYLAGPTMIGTAYYLSLTRKLTDNSPAIENGTVTLDNNGTFLGYITMVMKAKPLYNIINDTSGLDSTGIMALLEFSSKGSSEKVSYVFPCSICGNNTANIQLFAEKYLDNGQSSGAVINGYFINGTSMSVGYAPVNIFPSTVLSSKISPSVDQISISEVISKIPVKVIHRQWGVLVFQAYDTIYGPLFQLRNMLLISGFCIGFGICVATLFLSSWAVKPIMQLQTATEQSAPHFKPDRTSYSQQIIKLFSGLRASSLKKFSFESRSTDNSDNKAAIELASSETNFKGSDTSDGTTRQRTQSANGRRLWYFPWKRTDNKRLEEPALEHSFRIPERVVIRRWIKDELTDLADAFNEMTDELRKQYTTLEERVIQRTREIEYARMLAESANEAKSFFIANITHELRTPLNGILGMTSVSMDEQDPKRIRRSLRIIFKSGELLLHLLTDLLTFSKSQDSKVKLDEKEFMVSDITTQIAAIFRAQSTRDKVTLDIQVVTSTLSSLVLYGDVNRILQIVINLISNSLKFTPPGGTVTLMAKGIQPFEPEESSFDSSFVQSLSTKHSDGEEHKENQGCQESEDSVKEVKSNGKNMQQDSNATLKGDDGVLEDSNKTVGHKEEAARNRSETDKTENQNDDIQSNDREPDRDRQPRLFSVSSFPSADTMNVVFEVRDTGPGIASHLQSRVFEPFVQGDIALTEKRGGVGLGLSICRQLASALNGTVELIGTELGKGSIFQFKFPVRIVKDGARYSLSDSSEDEDWEDDSFEVNGKTNDILQSEPLNVAESIKSQGSLVSDSQSSNSKRPGMVRNYTNKSKDDDQKIKFDVSVLIAEDNKVNQEVMIRMLQLEGIESIMIANDGLEAVSLVRDGYMNDKRPYDIIFMDVQMPNLDGIQATGIIRDELQFRGHIIGVSAFADKSNIDKCLGVEMNQFLPKPIRRPLLHKLLLDILSPVETPKAV